MRSSMDSARRKMSEVPSRLQILEEEQQRFEAAVALYIGIKPSEVKFFRNQGRYPERPAVDFAWIQWQVAVGLREAVHKDAIKPYIDPEDF